MNDFLNEFQIFVMCPPFFLSNKIKNNPWMTSFGNSEINISKAISQWYNIYSFLSSQAIVLTLPPNKNLQDQTYVNSFTYLFEFNTIILSNFTAEGREGEEEEVKKFFENFGFKILKPPYKFESPDLKIIPTVPLAKEYIIIGGFGVRTEYKFWEWLIKEIPEIEKKLILIDMSKNKYAKFLYHLDCILFPIMPNIILLAEELISSDELNQIKKSNINIIPIPTDFALQGITNSIKCFSYILNIDNSEIFKEDSEIYEIEIHKNKLLIEICEKLGLIPVFFKGDEFLKSGALASCLIERLNYLDF